MGSPPIISEVEFKEDLMKHFKKEAFTKHDVMEYYGVSDGAARNTIRKAKAAGLIEQCADGVRVRSKL